MLGRGRGLPPVAPASGASAPRMAGQPARVLTSEPQPPRCAGAWLAAARLPSKPASAGGGDAGGLLHAASANGASAPQWVGRALSPEQRGAWRRRLAASERWEDLLDGLLATWVRVEKSSATSELMRRSQPWPAGHLSAC